MTNLTKVFAGALAATLVSSTLAVAGSGFQIQVDRGELIDKGVIQLAKSAKCMVAGTPSEFPNDIWFTNTGASKLSAGTKIQWTVNGGGKGTYVLVADLSPASSVHATNINGGIEAGRNCSAKVL